MRDASRILPVSIAALCGLAPAPAAAAGLNLNPDMQLLVTNVVVFSLLIWPTNKLLIQPLLGVIREREDRCFGTLQRAEALAAESADARTDLEERLSRMRGEAQVRRAELLGEADASERAMIEKARERAAESVDEVRRTVAMELDEARRALQADTRRIAEEAAAKILGRPL